MGGITSAWIAYAKLATRSVTTHPVFQLNHPFTLLKSSDWLIAIFRGRFTPESHGNTVRFPVRSPAVRYISPCIWRGCKSTPECTKISACTTFEKHGTTWYDAHKRTKFEFCFWGAVNVLAPAANLKGSAFWMRCRKHTFPSPCSGANHLLQYPSALGTN